MSIISINHIFETFCLQRGLNVNSKTIAILGLPDSQLLDIAGPLDVFSEANRQYKRDFYKTFLITPTKDDIQTSCGIRLVSDYCIYDQLPEIDTLLVAGSPSMPDLKPNSHLTDWLTRTCQKVNRYGSICTGTFLLAETQLLEGKQATTHWSVAEKLQEKHPNIQVNSDSFCIQDNNLYTSAGVTSGIDLALLLVEQDLGRDLARDTAMHLVTVFKRHGTQRQFSDQIGITPHGVNVLNDLKVWVSSNLSEEITVKTLADKIGITTRHLSRIFSEEIGLTPAKWLQQIRLQHATKLLREKPILIKQVIAECGLKNEQALRKIFIKNLGVTPAQYKKIYQYKF